MNKRKRAVGIISAVICAVLLIIPCFAFASHASDTGLGNTATEEEAVRPTWRNIRYFGGLVTYYFGEWSFAVDSETNEQYVVAGVNLPAYIAAVVICAGVAYLIGSISPTIMISTKKYGMDIRSAGSGNAGTTNMLRLFGWKIAALSFALDVLKSAAAVIVAVIVGGEACGYIAAVFAVVGHAWPCYFHFHGGKGVACAAAAILVLEPVVGVLLLAIFVLIVVATKFISLGSIMSALLYPLLLSSLYQVIHHDMTAGSSGIPILCSFIIGALVVFLHRSNIKRLYDGNENKFSFKKKPAVEANAVKDTTEEEGK